MGVEKDTPITTENQRTSTDDLLAAASDWLTNGSVVDDETHARLDQIARNNNAKLRLFENVLALKKAERLHKLHCIQDTIQDKLFDPAVLSKIKDPNMLMRLAYFLKDSTKEDEAYVQRVSSGGVDPAVTSLLHQMEAERESSSETMDKIRSISPQKRELLRKVVDRAKAHEERRNRDVG